MTAIVWAVLLASTPRAAEWLPIAGTVTDAAGRPVAGAEIYAGVYAMQRGGAGDAAGAFTLEIDGVMYTEGTPIDLFVSANGFLQADVRVPLGTRGLSVVLDRGVVVGGTLAGEGPHPSEVGIVTRGLRGKKGPTATVGADGRFETGGVPPGEAILVVTAPGRAPLTLPKRPLAGTVDLGELTLVPGVTLDIRVVDAHDAALPEADVEASLVLGGYHHAHFAASTDASGQAVLEHVPPGPLALRIRHPLQGSYSHHDLAVTGAPRQHVRLQWVAGP